MKTYIQICQKIFLDKGIEQAIIQRYNDLKTIVLSELNLLNYNVQLIQDIGLNFMKKPLNISNNLDLFFNKFSFEYIGKALSLAFNKTI